MAKTRKSPDETTGKNEKPAARKPGTVPAGDQRDKLQILAEDIALFNGGEVGETKVRGDVLVILLTDGRKFKVRFKGDDPAPVL